MTAPEAIPRAIVRVHLPIELAGGPLARAVALVQGERAAAEWSARRGAPVRLVVRWMSGGADASSLRLLNRHLLLTEVRLEPDSADQRAALRAHLLQLLSPGPNREPALERYLPSPQESLRAAAERLWSSFFPGLEFEPPEQPGTPAQGAGGSDKRSASETSGAASLVLAEYGLAAGASPLPRVWLIGSATERALERLGLPWSVALAEPLQESAPAPAGPPPPVIARLRAIAAQVRADLVGLRGELAEVDRGLAPQARRAAVEAEAVLEVVARRAERIHQNRSGTRRRHQRRAANALWPLGRPQIEVLACLQYGALYGERWLETLRSGLSLHTTQAQGLRLELPGLV